MNQEAIENAALYKEDLQKEIARQYVSIVTDIKDIIASIAPTLALAEEQFGKGTAAGNAEALHQALFAARQLAKVQTSAMQGQEWLMNLHRTIARWEERV